jgi:hypothetical protein
VLAFTLASAAIALGYFSVQSRPVRVRSCARPLSMRAAMKIRPALSHAATEALMEPSQQAGKAGAVYSSEATTSHPDARVAHRSYGPCHRTFNDTRHEHEPSRRNRLTQDENATMVPHRAVDFCLDGGAPTTSIASS